MIILAQFFNCRETMLQRNLFAWEKSSFALGGHSWTFCFVAEFIFENFPIAIDLFFSFYHGVDSRFWPHNLNLSPELFILAMEYGVLAFQNLYLYLIWWRSIDLRGGISPSLQLKRQLVDFRLASFKFLGIEVHLIELQWTRFFHTDLIWNYVDNVINLFYWLNIKQYDRQLIILKFILVALLIYLIDQLSVV